MVRMSASSRSLGNPLIRSGLIFAPSCLGALECQDNDDALGTLTKREFGSGLTCGQLVLLDDDGVQVCKDKTVEKFCCKQCELITSIWDDTYTFAKRQLLSMPALQLRSGRTIPAMALGTSGLQGEIAARVVEFALRVGYRALDTAIMYGNHRDLAAAVQASGVDRDDIFLTSKIPPWMMGFERAARAVHRMLDELNTTYIDLCLVHSPEVSIDGATESLTQASVARDGTWRALELAQGRGLCRDIGVSNYMPVHLDELFASARRLPVVNQFEYHPYQVDADTWHYCHKHGILVQAYASIAAKDLIQDSVVIEVAAEVGRAPAQVLLKWGLQQGAMVLPKSSRPMRILENAMLWDFILSPNQMERLSKLHKNLRTYLNPHAIPTTAARNKLGTYTR